MTDLLPLLQTLTGFSPLAVIALLSVIILLLVKQDRGQAAMRSNDLGELPEMAATLRRIEARLGEVSDHVLWIKARTNGK